MSQNRTQPTEQPPAQSDAEAEATAAEEQRRRLAFADPALKFAKLFSDLATPTNIIMVLGLGAVLITGLFSGWDAAEAQEDAVPTAVLGDSVSAHPFEITVHEATWTQNPDPIPGGYDGEQFFVVRATISSVDSNPVPATVLRQAVRANIAGVELEPEPGLWSNLATTDGSLGDAEVYRTVDGQQARSLQPSLGQEYWMLWRLPPSTPVAADMELTLIEHTWRASALEDSEYWADPTVVMTMTVEAAMGDSLP